MDSTIYWFRTQPHSKQSGPWQFYKTFPPSGLLPLSKLTMVKLATLPLGDELKQRVDLSDAAAKVIDVRTKSF